MKPHSPPPIRPRRTALLPAMALAVALVLGWAPGPRAGAATASDITADWPQWRGPQRTGHAAPGQRAPERLGTDLKPQWKVAAGSGFAGLVIAQGTLVVFAEDGRDEVVIALDSATGRERWRTPVGPRFEDEWGAGPRSTPLIDGGHVYAQSCVGEFSCLRLADGTRVWSTSFERDFGVVFLGNKANEGTARRRGNNGSGVIDGNTLVLPVGGTSGNSLVAFDKRTGKVLWRCGDDEAAYASLMVGELAGVRQVIAFTADALLGADLATGRLLWRVPLKTNAKRHAATPVLAGNRVLANSHTFGTVCFEIRRRGDALEAVELWRNTDLKINVATPVRVGDHCYSQGPAKDLVCFDAATGAVKWSQPGFGSGRKDYASVIALANRLLVLAEDGQLVLVEASPAAYRELGRAQVCGNTWAFPAYADGRLFVRDNRSVSCYDLNIR